MLLNRTNKSAQPNFLKLVGLCLAYFFTTFFIYVMTAVPNNNAVFATNIIILTISYFGMFFGDKKPYSLVKIVYVFIFFFFGFIPLNDLSNENVYWGFGSAVREPSLVITNLLIIIGVISFSIGSNIKCESFSKITKFFNPKISNNKYHILLVFFAVAFFILYAKDFNIYSLLFRGIVADYLGPSVESSTQPEMLVFDNFIRPLPLVVITCYVYLERLKKLSGVRERGDVGFSFSSIGLLFLLLSSFILVAPTSVPRFQAAALYIPIILIFTRFWNKPYQMQISILGALLIVMPFLDQFRKFDPNNFNASIEFSFLNAGHFDAYQNFSRIVEQGLVTNGQQLFGSLLFFVPRALWEDKPVGSGHFLADVLGYSFSNISMPFIAEGYINFGVFGVFVFMFLLGFVLGNADRAAWIIKNSGTENLYLYYYYFLFGMVFFIMRGDFMSSFAYTMGLTASFLSLVYSLNILRFKLTLR